MSIRTAVIGVGYLGKFHAEKYTQLDNCRLVAVVDNDIAIAEKTANINNTLAETDYSKLYGQVDAVSIATPTQTHHNIARDFLEKGIHVLLEKPITVSLEEADDLIEIAQANNCIFQIGHLERFNPAVLALDKVLENPLFIESYRLAPFKLRATDVNVLLDLMIHDIDIISNLIKSNLIEISANGAPILSQSTDIANARLTFQNGCVANVTASRVSLKSERKMRIFQENAYIAVDFENRILSEHYKEIGQDQNSAPRIASRNTNFEQTDALLTEISSFIAAVSNNSKPLVTGEDGRRALHTTLRINEIL